MLLGFQACTGESDILLTFDRSRCASSEIKLKFQLWRRPWSPIYSISLWQPRSASQSVLEDHWSRITSVVPVYLHRCRRQLLYYWSRPEGTYRAQIFQLHGEKSCQLIDQQGQCSRSADKAVQDRQVAEWIAVTLSDLHTVQLSNTTQYLVCKYCYTTSTLNFSVLVV